MVATGQVIITSERKCSLPRGAGLMVGEGPWYFLPPVFLWWLAALSADKLVFSVGTDRMIHAVCYIIKAAELKMSKPGC